MNARAIDTFHKTRLGHLVFGVLELGLSLAALNWAIGNGSLWIWALAFVLLFGFLQNFVYMLAVHKK
ncbi:MAG: hypothetical protein WDN27_04010 [Candidatus Saccharibacteria bacterium]